MMYAQTNGGRCAATPKARGRCPACEGTVIAKCGDINVHHWAHESRDCDPWAEGETHWHRQWKELFPEDCREVTLRHGEHLHRADVKRGNRVIEFQHSPLSLGDITDRETFYHRILLHNMSWVVDASGFESNIEFYRRGSLSGPWHTFRWKWARKAWAHTMCDLYLDLDGVALFWVRKMYINGPCRGWGEFLSREEFLCEQ